MSMGSMQCNVGMNSEKRKVRGAGLEIPVREMKRNLQRRLKMGAEDGGRVSRTSKGSIVRDHSAPLNHQDED